MIDRSESPMMEVAKEAALSAGALLRRRFRTEFQVSRKGPIDFVTEIDVQSEQIIVDTIERRFPDHEILAEERGASARRSAFRWIIDPLDGTTNYSHGFPAFVVSIAWEREGRLDGAVIHDPIAGELFHAARGQGAFLNDERICVSSTAELNLSLLGTGFSYEPEALRRNVGLFGEFMVRVAGVRRVGAAARDLAFVASGRYDGVWELNLRPWDLAAGILLVEEAGGKVTDFRGRPCGPQAAQIVLSNGKIHGAMLEVLSQHADRTQEAQ
jgi:myo-inositol-1(or 4)-monophosphatase